MSESRIRAERNGLKYKLIFEQKVMHHGKFVSLCPYCNERLATDMHEGLVKRSDVQSLPEEVQLLIYCKENCIVLCHECHMQHGQTSYMTEWFVEYRTSQGHDLEAWLRSLPFKVTPRLGYVGGHKQ